MTKQHWIVSKSKCPHCGHESIDVYHLFTSSIECGQCGYMFKAPLTDVFHQLKREEITMSRAAELIGMPFFNVRMLYDDWDAFHYPRNIVERMMSALWKARVYIWDKLISVDHK